MKHVQSSAAKTHLAELLDAVEQGETIVITRHGKPIAHLIPTEEARRERVRKAIEGIKALRGTNKGATIEEIIVWKNEGRR